MLGALLILTGLLPVSAPAAALAATPIFINEIHYDNAGTDAGEAIEIAGPAGTDLTGWSIILYNGADGNSYSAAFLSGTIGDEGGGFGAATVSYSVNGIQNGSPDGIALVHSGALVQFLSYEGAFVGATGPAAGVLSTDIGVSEDESVPIGRSLGLVGSGTSYEDFIWTTNLDDSFSLINPGQTFGSTPTNPSGTGAASPSSVAAGGSSLLTVAVTPGQNPTSTALAVAADLTSIGGSATQAFYDDATHGDVLAGDNVFSFQATVDASTTPGSKSLPATITDAQARFGSATIALAVTTPPPPPGTVVVSEVYGGGGNAGATLRNDFIELFNRTASPVSVAGWSVQYGSSSGTGLWQVTNLTGTIPANGYYLVQEAQGAGGSLSLPTPDAVGTIAMAAGAGKVAVVTSTTALSGACPASASILDKVGYGAANCSETATTPALTNTTSASRKGGGSIDTDNNLADFTVGDPSPRGATEPGPQVIATFPTHTGTDAATQGNLSVTFSEPVDVTGTWFTLNCATSGSHTATATGGPTVFILDPAVDFSPSESCTLTIVASQVTDQDTDDPSDAMSANFIATFTTGAVENCGDPATLISSAQGSGPATTLSGSISIEGVVVGDYQAQPSQFGGFHLQEQDADADGNPATSEGIFVFHGLSGLPVQPGDVVRVRGAITEFSNLTEISPTRRILVCSGGASVTPAPVHLPVASLAKLESVESMSVDLEQELTVTEVFNLGRFGEVSLSGTGRLPTPTNVVAPGAPAIALEDLNDRSRIILDDANNLQNMDPTAYPQGGLSASNTLRVGDTVHGDALNGVLEERFGAYRVQPVGAISFDHTNPRAAAPEAVGGNLRVASFNVLNFFNGDGLGGGFPTPRGATTLAEFQRQLAKEVSAITTLDADIVGLMELENDAAGHSAIEDLVAALNDATGPGTYAFINTGIVGTDQIRVGLLYKPAAVTPVGAFAVIDSSVDPDFIDTRNRPSLAQTFALNATGARVTIVVNHLKSKGSDCNSAPLIDPDTGDGQGNCNLTRTAAAQAINDWLATDPTSSGDPDYLLIGDMNSYAMEDPITAFKDAGYVDSINAHIGTSAYSYVFDGESGYLDHALSSATLAGQISDVTEWHINPDEPTVLDYNVEFKTANQVNTFYAPDAYRSSDHDPVLVGINLNAAPTVDAGGPYAVVEGGSVTVSATGSDPDNDTLTYAWDLDDNGSFETPGQSVSFAAALLQAPATLTISVQVSDGQLTVTDNATVNVIWAFGGFFQPVDNLPTENVAHAGAGIPIKFTLGGDQGLAVIAAGYPTSVEFACDASSPMDAIESTSSAGDAGLTYDAASGVYTYAWKTNKSWEGTCRRFVLKLADGTYHYADFKFVN
jgi:hypothetical protein